MRKIIFAVLLAVSSNVFGSGPYDGIWSIEPYGYTSISEKDGVMIAVNVYNSDYGGDWEAVMGNRFDNRVRAVAVVSEGNAILDILMTSDNTFTVTLVSCTPSDRSANYCLYPPGTVIMYGNKIW